MRIWTSVAASLLLFSLAAAAQQLRPLTVSPQLPAASGTVGIAQDTSGTTYVSMQVKHLARPEQLQPAKAAYVVWIQAAGRQPENHGTLPVDQNETAKYTTTTRDHDFQVFVTAEDNPKTSQPSGPVLLRSHS
jgi:hypothetical protein